MTLPHPGSLTPSEVLRISRAEIGKGPLPIEYQHALIECLEFALQRSLAPSPTQKYNPRAPLIY